MGPWFWERDQLAVGKVEALILDHLYELQEERARYHGGMPSLRMLTVSQCPKLKSFPFDVSMEDVSWRKEDDTTCIYSESTNMVAKVFLLFLVIFQTLQMVLTTVLCGGVCL